MVSCARRSVTSCGNSRHSPPVTRHSSGFRLGFAETRDAVAGLPLAAFLEEFGALKTLENIAFATKGGSCAQAAML
jgi:hypothetical protein